MRKSTVLLALIFLVCAATVASASTPKITIEKINITKPEFKYIVPSSFVPPEVIQPVSKNILEKANATLYLTPIYQVSGAGYAIFDNYHNVVFTTASSARTALTYDSANNIFATIAPCTILNIPTGKKYTVAGGTVFKLLENGTPVTICKIPASATTGAQVTFYKGLLVVDVGWKRIYIYNENIYPNGSVQFAQVKQINVTELADYLNKTYGVKLLSNIYIDNAWISSDGDIYLSGRISALTHNITNNIEGISKITPQEYATSFSSIYIEMGGDLVVLDSSGNVVSYIPVDKTNIVDLDVLIPNPVLACFSNVASNTGYIDNSVVYGSPTKAGDMWPIYMAAAETSDGQYIFAYKNIKNALPVGSTTLRECVLEVWHDGSLVRVVNNPNDTLYMLDASVGTTQPRSVYSYAMMSPLEIIPFPTGLVIYNLGSKQYRLIGFDHSATGRLAAISHDGRYVVMGNKVYSIGYVLNIPAILYEGKVHIYNGASDVNLNKTIVYDIPSDTNEYGYVMRVLSGDIYIGKIYSKKRTVDIITDRDAKEGLLWNMYKRGLITTFQSTNVPGNGIVTDQKLLEGTDPTTGKPSPHSITYIRIHELKPWAPYIATARVGSAIDIQIPINVPLPASSYKSLNLHYDLSYATVVPEYVQGKLVGIALAECGAGIGSVIAGSIAMHMLANYGGAAADELTATGTVEDAVASAWSTTAGQALSKAMPIIGIAMIADGVWGYYNSLNIMHQTGLKTFMMVVPEFVTSTGQHYAVVHLFIPSFANVDTWEKRAEDVLNHAGIHNYVIQVTVIPASSWDEFQSVFAHSSPSSVQKMVNMEEGLSALATKYGVPLYKLKLVKVHLYIDSVSEGSVNLWTWITGGLKFHVLTTVVAQSGFTGKAVIPAQVITNPDEICKVLNPVYINAHPVNLTPSGDMAVAHFMLPFKTQLVTIDFHKPYYASMTADLLAQLIAPLHNDKPGLYETNFTYSWKYCFNESKIMFIGMPYKMVDAYETVYTTHGNEPVNMTPYMSFITAIKDNSSPTHVRYYYGTVTRHDLMLIDPHNAGLMEPQKRFWIQYWYKPPQVVMGDASIHVMFNGTTLSSTLPRHARVIINSSRPQTVYGYLQVIVGYEDQKSHQFHTVDTHTFDFALRVGANGSTYKEWDIQKYVGEAIHQYALGKVGYVKLVGKITKAAYDYVKTNDEDSLVYYPPASLTKTKPVVVTIDVMNAQTHSPIAGANVMFDNSSYTTNAAGLVNISTTSGYHSVVVSATGYYTKKTGVMAYTNMTFDVYLIPKNGNYVILPPNGTNPNPTWVAPNGTTGNGTPPGAPPLPVGKNNTTGWTNLPILYNTTNHTYLLPVEVVVQYSDGMPVQGATVKFLNATTGALVSTVETDGTGYAYAYVPEYYNLTVNVTYTSANYTSQETVLVDHPLILPFTVPENSQYFEPEVAVNNVSIWIHMGLGEIPQGTGMAPVYHSVDCWFYTNVPQNITFKVWLVNTKTNETVASGTFTVHLHKGFQRVREFIPVNVSNFTTCQVFCQITNYQYDTNPYNNMAVGNIVTFRPYVDIYPTVVWYPIKQKVSDALLPGDLVKVCIGVHVPKGVHLPDIHVDYAIKQDVVGKHRMKDMQARSLMFNSVGQVTTIWYNYTIQLPWTDKVVINASVNNTYDLAPDNNNASATIPISPDSACISARPQSLVVSSNNIVPVRIVIRSNYIDTVATVSVIDVTDHNTTLTIRNVNITAPEQSIVVPVKAPPISGKISENHVWMVTVFVPGDIYANDSVKQFTVTIWGIPSWIVLLGIFFFVVLILLMLRHLLTIRPPRQGRYFKRVDGEGRDSFGAAKIGYKRGKGRYFQKFK